MNTVQLHYGPGIELQHSCNIVNTIFPFLGVERCVPGVYAVSVSGELPGDIVESLKDQGRPFIPRDRSTKA